MTYETYTTRLSVVAVLLDAMTAPELLAVTDAPPEPLVGGVGVTLLPDDPVTPAELPVAMGEEEVDGGVDDESGGFDVGGVEEGDVGGDVDDAVSEEEDEAGGGVDDAEADAEADPESEVGSAGVTPVEDVLISTQARLIAVESRDKSINNEARQKSYWKKRRRRYRCLLLQMRRVKKEDQRQASSETYLIPRDSSPSTQTPRAMQKGSTWPSEREGNRSGVQ